MPGHNSEERVISVRQTGTGIEEHQRGLRRPIRIATGAASTLLAITLAAPAAAQSCHRPAEPYIPSGDATDHAGMQMASDEVGQYLRDMTRYRSCIENHLFDIDATMRHVQDSWNREIGIFNSR